MKKKYFSEEERKAAANAARRRYRADGKRSLEIERQYAAKARAKRREIFTPEQLSLRSRKERLWLGFGLTIEMYDAILQLQGGVCGGCGRPPTGRNLDVDHEHVRNFKKMPPERKRSFVRMLLCHRCNRAIGLLGNEPGALRETLLRLAERMETYRRSRNILLNIGVENGVKLARETVAYLEAYEERK